MKKVALYGLVGFFSCLMIATTIYLYKRYATQIYIDSDNHLYFSGTITFENVEKIKKIYSLAESKPTVLHIKSPGGMTAAGGSFGEWVHQRQLHVLVTNFCYSACANYVFPAGQTSVLGRHATLGWHGGAHSKLTRSKEGTYSLRTDTDKQKLLADLEREFYEDIKVDPQLPTYGGEARYNEFNGGGYYNNGYDYFYYSLEDMKKMGINIVLKDGGWKEPNKPNFYKVTL